MSGKMIIGTILFLNFTLGTATQAQEEAPAKVPIDPAKQLEVSYASSPWNKDSTKVDNAELFVRDATTGKIVKILLQETEPDSSTFTGYFSVNFAQPGEFAPEVYIPPKKIRGHQKSEQQFIEQIRSQKTERKPVVFKKGLDGQQRLDVFDTKEQANASLQAFQEKKKQELAQKSLVKPVPDKKTEEVAKMAAHQAKLAELAVQAASREEERIRKEQIERQKAEERRLQQQKLREAEKQKRREKAKELAEQALQKYKAGDYTGAEPLFVQSIELDPNNKDYYFQYGVTLYRNNKFDDALVALKLAEVEGNTKTERDYFMGLIHYRLSELDQAEKRFTDVKNSGRPVLAPSGAFYLGVIRFTQEKYEEAKEPFEFVLDTSSDPRLDEQAESYIEKIANALVFKKKQERAHDGSVSIGTMYDSNVLFSPDNQTSTAATNKGGLRFITTASHQWRAIYEREFDWSTDINFAYYYSLEDTHAIADPMLISLAGPLSWKGVWGKKGYKLSLSPGYEMLYMDPDNTGSRYDILNSILFDVDLTLIMSETWFATYALDMRSDDSLTSDSTGDNDADAFQPTLKTQQTFFVDKGKKRAVIVDGSYTLNSAKGKEKTYNKINLGVTYTQPFKKWKDAAWNSAITVYNMDYPDGTAGRTDRNATLSYSVTKNQNAWFLWSTTLSYSTNNSTSSSNQYSKYSILLNASFDIDEWYYRDKK